MGETSSAAAMRARISTGTARDRRGQQFSFSGTNCSMAAGLPYAIGAAAAYPGRQVVDVLDESSFEAGPGPTVPGPIGRAASAVGRRQAP